MIKDVVRMVVSLIDMMQLQQPTGLTPGGRTLDEDTVENERQAIIHKRDQIRHAILEALEKL